MTSLNIEKMDSGYTTTLYYKTYGEEKHENRAYSTIEEVVKYLAEKLK